MAADFDCLIFIYFPMKVLNKFRVFLCCMLYCTVTRGSTLVLVTGSSYTGLIHVINERNFFRVNPPDTKQSTGYSVRGLYVHTVMYRLILSRVTTSTEILTSLAQRSDTFVTHTPIYFHAKYCFGMLKN